MACDLPQIPGIQVLGLEAQRRRSEISRMLSCGNQFPGAQPVSFCKQHLDTLVREDYYVCEKSDGIRLLMYCSMTEDGRQAVTLIDRKNKYYDIHRQHFPLPDDSSCKNFHTKTIIDGELVVDNIDGRKELVFLAFDLLMYQGQDVRESDLPRRLGTLKEMFVKPLHKFLRDNPGQHRRSPFRIEVKRMELSYDIEMMYRDIIPKLNHGNDGLIFTSTKARYSSGTDETLLKWKAAEENTVDFQLKLRFPILDNGKEDVATMPDFGLFAYYGDASERYRFFAYMYVSDSDFAKIREVGEQCGGLENAIVECNLDAEGRWRFMRVRDDKQDGNHISVIYKVLQSIEDGVTMQELKVCSYQMRKAYKERHKAL